MKFFHYILMLMPLTGTAQSVSFDEDALDRGYYDRPWARYEAEPNRCNSNGIFLTPEPEYSQLPLQAEATNGTALMLSRRDEYVEWEITEPGRGLTLRFSIPDAQGGGGLKGVLSVKVDNEVVGHIELDSRWAWQYTPIAYAPEKYPDNIPADDKFARMRFDEVHMLLDEEIPAGAKLRLSKAEDDDIEYCIDFVELESVAEATAFDNLPYSDKVLYDGSTPLLAFVSANQGKAIFIPAGTYNIDRQLHITAPGTRIIGAGLWYTRLYFSTPSDSRSTYNARGIHCNASDVVVEGMSINTANDKRYYDNNPAYQVGKGLNGSWGTNSVVRDVLIEHFECGGWITGAKGLRIERCRFRNNYADGINLANNSSNCIVTHCSFRNNGDDDMASWSTGEYASDNEFSFCTAENNWRASSLGFFGGRRGRAHHIAIYDAMEAGARVVCDFNGTGFSTDGYFELSDISIRRCGAIQGTSGTQGGFWGNSAAALQIGAGWAYDLNNICIHDVDIHDSRFDAISIKCSSSKRINNLVLRNININGVDGYAYGINIDASVVGNGSYGNINAREVTEPFMSQIPAGFDFVSTTGIVNLCPDEPYAQQFYDLGGCNVSNPLCGHIYIVKNLDGCKKIIFK